MPTSPTLQDEVAFISGVKADGTLTPYSYWGWNNNTPATYNTTWTRASKFGGTTAGSAGGTVYYYFDPKSAWTATEQTQLASGLALWAAVANINFVQTTTASQGKISFTRGTDSGAYTYTIYSASSGACVNGGTTLGTIVSAPISIDTTGTCFGPINGVFANGGGYPIETFLHEEGHALGLGHAGPYNGSVNGGTQQYSAYDTRQWSIMSYINGGATAKYSAQNPVQGTNWGGAYPTTWMPLDILAIQQLYGVAVNTPLSGGQVFGFNCNIDPSIKQYFDFTVNKKPIITIWDKGTNNTLDLSGFTQASTVDLNPGTFSSTAGLRNNIAIAFGTAVDKLVCSAGATTVTCNNDGDTVTGGAGNDVFIGGTGNDILDGGAGTDVVKYSGVSTAYTITDNSDGTITVSGNGAGIDTLSNIESLQFSDKTLTVGAGTPPPAPPPASTQTLTGQRDFNGDGKGDVLLGNNGCSSVQIWSMDGTTKQSGATLAGPGTNWATVLTGDFNGDGKTDLLWQNTATRAIQIWTMNGTTKASSGTVSMVPGADWCLVATGDFNGDKAADIVFQNGNQVAVWLMKGATRLAGSTIISAAAPGGYSMIGTGDFNGDGSADILWQNSTTGQLDIWMMNGTNLASDNLLASNPGASWSAVTTGDFNGDGKSDILLQDSATGQAAVWLMDGVNQLAGSGNLSTNLGTDWRAVASADYNGDGVSDILFRSTSSGALTAWMMSGSSVTSGGALSANPGTTWHAVSNVTPYTTPESTTSPPPVTIIPPPPAANAALADQRDFNGDGKGDVLLGNYGCASVQIWLMDGTTKQSGATLAGPGTNWAAVLTGDFNGDGKVDLLWQNTATRAIQIWTMNGTTKASSGTVSMVPSAAWSLVATGDFNGDKAADIVFQNGSQVAVWLMKGAARLAGSTIINGTGQSGFNVVATGDFNGDGSADILWQNSTTGQLDIWMMNGTTLASDTLLSANPGATWRAVTTGDFNGDGKSDILLQDSATGQAAIWLMDGVNQLAGSGNLSTNLGTDWRAVASADYNGDSVSDILFRSTSSGALTAWMMSGTTMTSGGVLSANPGTAWHAVAG